MRALPLVCRLSALPAITRAPCQTKHKQNQNKTTTFRQAYGDKPFKHELAQVPNPSADNRPACSCIVDAAPCMHLCGVQAHAKRRMQQASTAVMLRMLARLRDQAKIEWEASAKCPQEMQYTSIYSMHARAERIHMRYTPAWPVS